MDPMTASIVGAISAGALGGLARDRENSSR